MKKENLGLKGFFEIVKRKTDGSIVEAYVFENLILDSGLEMIGLRKWFNYCHLGSGNNEPNVTQTGLSSPIGYSGIGFVNETWSLDTEEKSLTKNYKARFEAGVATGNIAEIGLADSSSSNGMFFCRTLIKDNQGRPTVISKLADEILDIYYKLKFVINHQDVTGECLISGEPYNFIIRPAYLGNSNTHDGIFSKNEIGDITAYPIIQDHYRPVNVSNYTPKSNKLRFTIHGDVDMNYPIRSIMIRDMLGFRWQAQYSRKSDGSAIPKTGNNIVNLPIEVSWGRA